MVKVGVIKAMAMVKDTATAEVMMDMVPVVVMTTMAVTLDTVHIQNTLDIQIMVNTLTLHTTTIIHKRVIIISKTNNIKHFKV